MRLKDYPPLNATSTYRHEFTKEYDEGPRRYEGAHWRYTGRTDHGNREILIITSTVYHAICWSPETADLICQALIDRRRNTQ